MTTSTEIIEKRDKLSADITRTWNIIKMENVVFRGFKRNYDMKVLLDSIFDKCKERIEIKLQSLALNLGFTDINDLPEDSIYPTIFAVGELKEIKKQLSHVPTLDPEIIKKVGKKRMKKTEVLTRGFVKNLSEALTIKINTLNKELLDYNAVHSLENTERKNAKVIDMSFSKEKAAA